MSKAAAKSPVRIQNIAVQLAEIKRRVWAVDVPVEHTAEDCVHPAYLWLRHDLLAPRDIVEMVREDFAFRITVMVVKVDQQTQSVHTRLIDAVDWSEQGAPRADLSLAIVEQAGADKWRVVLDKSVLSRGHATKADAQRWLDDHRGEQQRSEAA